MTIEDNGIEELKLWNLNASKQLDIRKSFIQKPRRHHHHHHHYL